MTRQYITSQELQVLIDSTRLSENKADFIDAYQVLDDKGFGYAFWGKGVVTKATLEGVSAVNFMNATSPTGKPLTYEQEVAVNREMLQGYLKTLKDYADANGGRTNQEVNYNDLYEFHEKGFANVKIDDIPMDVTKNWTLYIPMEVLRAKFEAEYEEDKPQGYDDAKDYAEQKLEEQWQAIANSKDFDLISDAYTDDSKAIYHGRILAEAVDDYIAANIGNMTAEEYLAQHSDDRDNLVVEAIKWRVGNKLEGGISSDFETFIANYKASINNYYDNEDLSNASEIYKEKREEMIRAFIERAEQTPRTGHDHSYKDKDSNHEIVITKTDYSSGNNGIGQFQSEVIFGSSNPNEAETIESQDWGNEQDFLFGRAGDDTLIGGANSDYLEGGTGFDTYHIEDHDTIYDVDGDGLVTFDETPIGYLAWQKSNGRWESNDGEVVAIRDKDNLIVTKGDDQATITDFFTQISMENNTYSGYGISLGSDKEKAKATELNAEELNPNDKSMHIWASGDFDFTLTGGKNSDRIINPTR